MGLSSGNSLVSSTEGGGASGLTTSQVQTLIKNNTPWQYLTKLTADASSELEYTSIPSTFSIIRILYDGLQFNQNSAVNMRLYLDGSLETGNLYRTAGMALSGSSESNFYNTYSYWRPIDQYESGGSRYIMGFTDIGGNEVNKQKQMFNRISSVHSTSPTNYDSSGHLDTGSLNLVTGFKLYPASGTFSKGSIKIYGMN